MPFDGKSYPNLRLEQLIGQVAERVKNGEKAFTVEQLKELMRTARAAGKLACDQPLAGMPKRGIFTPFSLINHLLPLEHRYSWTCRTETPESRYLTTLEHAHTTLFLARADHLIGLVSDRYLMSCERDFEESLTAGGAANDNSVNFGYPKLWERRSPILVPSEDQGGRRW